ncbi:hypothetical protein ACJX0J_013173, partial [Zea mays]
PFSFTHRKKIQIAGVLEEYLDYKRQHNDKLLDVVNQIDQQDEGCNKKEEYCIGKCVRVPYLFYASHSGDIFNNFYFVMSDLLYIHMHLYHVAPLWLLLSIYLSKFVYNLFVQQHLYLQSISVVEEICLFEFMACLEINNKNN